MGLNTVSTYVFWNYHELEPGTYDFSGEKDVAEYVRLAQEEGLDVILRPGPYVCAEWDFGGLPAWLLANGARIRTTDERYMQPVREWLQRLGRELAPLQRPFGGSIVAVQLENEYGAFGSDAAYLRALRDALVGAGFGESPFYTIDQPGDLAAGALDEYPIAVTFAPGDAAREFARVRTLRPQAPLLCGEYWAGWFDHWGEQHHRLDADVQTRDLEWMLAAGASVNVYMFHGGTNFGFWNGANSGAEEPYQPTTTSYDYDAALDEAGRPAEKYFRFRETITRHTGETPPPVPDPPQTMSLAEFELSQSCSLFETLGESVHCDVPVSMEKLGQWFGYTMYRTEASGPIDAELAAAGVRDYAVVFVDGSIAGRMDRRAGESRLRVRSANSRVRIDILLENGGRINYGPGLPFERKGLVGPVSLGGSELHDWRVHSLPMTGREMRMLPFTGGACAVPALYRGAVHVERPADTFLDVSQLDKGALWVNGRNAGRFWNIGPQYSLYVPGSWLLAGANEIVAFDLFPHEAPPRLRGLRDPLIG